jgi:chromosome segregation ATPase
MFNFLHRDCKAFIDKLALERDSLKSQLPTLLGQIKEQKAILEYTMHEKEQHIESLQAEMEQLRKDNDEYQTANTELTEDNDILSGINIGFAKEIAELKQSNTDLQNKLTNLLSRGKRLTAEFKELHKDKIEPNLSDSEYRLALDKELSWQRDPDLGGEEESQYEGLKLSDLFSSKNNLNIKIVAEKDKPGRPKTKKGKK